MLKKRQARAGGAMRRNRARQEGQTVDNRPRPTDAEIAGRLHGTRGRLFVRQEDGAWLDTETGATGTRAELEQAWLAERQAVPNGRGIGEPRSIPQEGNNGRA